jgi:hypothetical protein
MPFKRNKLAAILMAAQPLIFGAPAFAPQARAAETSNLTGLPAYPNLTRAVMDGTFKTDTLGHWCMRFWADTSDSLTAVEAWYRKTLIGSSEIDLTHDKTYKNYSGVVGVKIVLGIDYVVVYKTSSQASTSIDLYRCSPMR